ncbi:MAG: hypothetical protein QMC87_06185, partial [Methanothermobacter thermautotrophicus]|nr:hypothetical protein [Methanothermobacter thermautotrophicus]
RSKSKTLTNEEMQNINGKFLQFIWSGIQAYMTVYGLIEWYGDKVNPGFKRAYIRSYRWVHRYRLDR